MKKCLALGLLSSLLLTSCSVDLNDAKEKRIGELEKQVTEMKKDKDLELQKFEFEKQKYEEQKDINSKKEKDKKEEIYEQECLTEKEENTKKYENFINTCTNQGGNSIDYCINSPAGKTLHQLSSKDLEICIEEKKGK